MHIDDGIAFVEQITDPYDVIIIDGSDPVGPAEGLFGQKFMQSCYNGLTENGVLTAQTESPWVESYHQSIRQVFTALDELYPISQMYLAYIPLYPAGMWSFAFAGKRQDPLADQTLQRVQKGVSAFDTQLRYYNPEVHRSSFALPNFVKEII